MLMGECQVSLIDGVWEGTPRSDAQPPTLEDHREKMCSARGCAGSDCQALLSATVITSPWDSRAQAQAERAPKVGGLVSYHQTLRLEASTLLGCISCSLSLCLLCRSRFSHFHGWVLSGDMKVRGIQAAVV